MELSKNGNKKIKISRRSRQPTSSESLAFENPTQASEVKSHPGAVSSEVAKDKI